MSAMRRRCRFARQARGRSWAVGAMWRRCRFARQARGRSALWALCGGAVALRGRRAVLGCGRYAATLPLCAAGARAVWAVGATRHVAAFARQGAGGLGLWALCGDAAALRGRRAGGLGCGRYATRCCFCAAGGGRSWAVGAMRRRCRFARQAGGAVPRAHRSRGAKKQPPFRAAVRLLISWPSCSGRPSRDRGGLWRSRRP